MNLKIAVLSGDGIGPEVTLQAKKALHAIGVVYNHEFVFEDAYIGAIAIEKTGKPLPEQTLNLCRNTDSILFGAIFLLCVACWKGYSKPISAAPALISAVSLLVVYWIASQEPECGCAGGARRQGQPGQGAAEDQQPDLPVLGQGRQLGVHRPDPASGPGAPGHQPEDGKTGQRHHARTGRQG